MTPKDLYPFMKKLKMSNEFLSKEMDYSLSYISMVMNGHRTPSEKFNKLLVLAISNRVCKDYNDFFKLMEGTAWEKYLP